MQGYLKKEVECPQTAQLLSRNTVEALRENDKKFEHSQDGCPSNMEKTEDSVERCLGNMVKTENSEHYCHGNMEKTEHSVDHCHRNMVKIERSNIGKIVINDHDEKIEEPIQMDMYHHIQKEVESSLETFTQENKSTEHSSLKAMLENTTAETCLLDSKENLMKFAEILYKCTLCTTVPSILTSESSFLSHMSEQHLNKQNSAIPCLYCELRFDTEEDLKSHMEISHGENSLSGGDDLLIPDDFHKIKTEEVPMAGRFSPYHEPSSWGTTMTPTPTQGSQRRYRKPTYVPTWSSFQEEDSQPQKSKDIECSPKVNIAHEAKSPHQNYVSPPTGENRARIQELTSEIFAKNCDFKNGPQNSEIRNPIGNVSMMNVSHTPEFGNYTKLVREGGSIVYFCQLCNWKSQVKLHFAGHCKNKSHVEKVKAAEEKRNVDQEGIEKRKMELPLSLVVKSESTKLGANDTVHSLENDTCGKLGSCAAKKLSPHRPNKRKRPSHSMIRYYDNKDAWNSSDSDSSNNSYFLSSILSNSPENEVKKCKQKKLLLHSPGKDGNHRKANVLDPEVSSVLNLSTTFPITSSGNFVNQSRPEKDMPSDLRNQFLLGTPNLNNAVFPEFKTESSNEQSAGSKIESSNENLVCSQIRKDETAQKPVGSALLNQLLSVKPFTNSALLVPELKSPRMQYCKSPSMHYCNVCHVDCETAPKLKRHMEMRHKIAATDSCVSVRSEEKEGVGEVGKIIKLKEIIPGLIFASLYGNVSRDQLLQKVSEVTGIPDATQWGPACNKAMRELYPESNAQRKGKYKKTYFFGVSFVEPQQDGGEDMSDSELSSLQSLRDVSHDLDRILTHIHDVLEWSDDMDDGVIREDLLSVLSVKMDETDILLRGMLCNKAIRVAFPMVKMMRKGKFKTTVYFGVRFKSHVQHLLPTSCNQSLSPFVLKKCRKKKTEKNIVVTESNKGVPRLLNGKLPTLANRMYRSYWPMQIARGRAQNLPGLQEVSTRHGNLYGEIAQPVDIDWTNTSPATVDTSETGNTCKSEVNNINVDNNCEGFNRKAAVNCKGMDVSSGENEDDSDEEDDADDERSASPSLPDVDDGAEGQQKKSGLVMRFKRNSSSETAKVDLASNNNSNSNFSAEILSKAKNDREKYAN